MAVIAAPQRAILRPFLLRTTTPEPFRLAT